jgi:hypothetical protein
MDTDGAMPSGKTRRPERVVVSTEFETAGLTLPEANSTNDPPSTPGDGVTTCGTPAPDILKQIEAFLAAYVSFAESAYGFVIALWVAATHIWQTFDAFPYLVVTSSTKRSGKTRVLELCSFVAANARSVAHVSPAAMFHTIHTNKPTIFVDEAEAFSSPHSEFRPLLNTGYRRGQTVLRQNGGNTVEYETYCPKAFALIGDVYDTLRDRSIVLTMRRGAPPQRFVFVVAQQDGAALRDMLHEIVESKSAEIYAAMVAFEGLPYLTDRDEEIWTPLFVICQILCPDRMDELVRAAVDMATAKTADAKKFTELAAQEKVAAEQEYSERLLLDMISIVGDRQHISTAELIPLLRAIPTSPWRKFRGAGLKDGIDGAMDIAALLSRFGVSPKTLRVAPKGAKNSTAKGYTRQALLDAAQEAGLATGRNVVTPEPITSQVFREEPNDPTRDQVPAQPLASRPECIKDSTEKAAFATGIEDGESVEWMIVCEDCHRVILPSDPNPEWRSSPSIVSQGILCAECSAKYFQKVSGENGCK